MDPETSEGVKTLRIALELQRIVLAVADHIKQAIGDDPSLAVLQSSLRLVLYNCSVFLDTFYATASGPTDLSQLFADKDSQACLDVLKETSNIISSGTEDRVERALVYFYEHQASFQVLLNEPRDEQPETNEEDLEEEVVSDEDEDLDDDSWSATVEDRLDPNESSDTDSASECDSDQLDGNHDCKQPHEKSKGLCEGDGTGRAPRRTRGEAQRSPPVIVRNGKTPSIAATLATLLQSLIGLLRTRRGQISP